MHTHVSLFLFFLFRIRRAGYPIRHTFEVFVERYRVLIPGLTLAEVKDFKYTSKMICNRVMEGHDWQVGYTKVFLKVCTCALAILASVFANAKNGDVYVICRNGTGLT